MKLANIFALMTTYSYAFLCLPVIIASFPELALENGSLATSIIAPEGDVCFSTNEFSTSVNKLKRAVDGINDLMASSALKKYAMFASINGSLSAAFATLQSIDSTVQNTISDGQQTASFTETISSTMSQFQTDVAFRFHSERVLIDNIRVQAELNKALADLNCTLQQDLRLLHDLLEAHRINLTSTQNDTSTIAAVAENLDDATTANAASILSLQLQAGQTLASASKILECNKRRQLYNADLDSCQALLTLTQRPQCTPETEGHMHFKRAASTLEICSSGEYVGVVSPVGTAANPAESCKQIDATASGHYYLRINNEVIKVWCDMKSDDGGWTLVMKISTHDTQQLDYSSSFWSDNSLLNADSANEEDNINMKNLAYLHLPFEQIRIAMNEKTTVHQHNQASSSVRQLLTGPEILTNAYSRSSYLDFTGLAHSSWNNQLNCNERGFQLEGRHYRCRYGMSMNNEDDCFSSDTILGLGCYLDADVRYQCAACSMTWYGPPQTIYARRAWIWVR
eukprot:TRINITY_DN8334_c0_g1_i3.p1 TRINITY_DN8334_c0_g1~~TRINITY_DN8334_c0_g1_i3.p1  ORF type:complete len:512 (+),score=75.17 TRINITY_DN8334_c0_g1_i3:1-1536(+)